MLIASLILHVKFSSFMDVEVLCLLETVWVHLMGKYVATESNKLRYFWCLSFKYSLIWNRNVTFSPPFVTTLLCSDQGRWGREVVKFRHKGADRLHQGWPVSPVVLYCGCGRKAVRHIAQTPTNRGRPFYTCSIHKVLWIYNLALFWGFFIRFLNVSISECVYGKYETILGIKWCYNFDYTFI